MQGLYDYSKAFFELPKYDENGTQLYDYVFFMSIGTKAVQTSDTSFSLLSYQLSTVAEFGWNSIFMPVADNMSRLPLSEIIAAGICSIGTLSADEFAERYTGTRILVIGVASSAASVIDSLGDRDASYVTDHLTYLQRIPVTDGQPIELSIAGSQVDFHLFDAHLLVPSDKAKSLAETLSDLMEEPIINPVQVSPFYLRNMDLFQRDCPEEFERFAMFGNDIDLNISLSIFMIFQKNLNDMVYGKPTKFFRSASSAAEVHKMNMGKQPLPSFSPEMWNAILEDCMEEIDNLR